LSISASQVKELRDRTGAGMMDCKRALADSGGDFEAALEFLRKKGLATAEKRKGRATNEGLVRIAIDSAAAGMVEVNCETDFVARNEEFEAFASALARHAAEHDHASLDELLQAKLDGGQTAKDALTALIGKIGENMLVSRFTRVALQGAGVLEPYLHAGGRVGVVVALGAPSAEAAKSPALREVAHELALQVAFSNPVCIERSGVPADVIAREERIARERALEQGKPEKIVPKIVEGQLNKFFSEVVLLEQPYVKDDKLSVQKWLEAQAKALGGAVKIQAIARFALGEASETAAEE
jgi:elongation factor Ts